MHHLEKKPSEDKYSVTNHNKSHHKINTNFASLLNLWFTQTHARNISTATDAVFHGRTDLMQIQICFEIKHKLMQTHIAVLWRWQRKKSMRESQRKTNKIYIYCQKSEIKINWSVAIDVKSGSCGCLYIKRGCGVSNNALKCFSIVSIYLNLNIQLHLFNSNDPQKKSDYDFK